MEKPNVSSASRMILFHGIILFVQIMNHSRPFWDPCPGKKKCCFHCFTSLHKLSIMTIKLWPLNPTHYITAPGKTGAESCNHDDIAMFYFSAPHRFIKRNPHGCRRSISISFDIHIHMVFGNTHFFAIDWIIRLLA